MPPLEGRPAASLYEFFDVLLSVRNVQDEYYVVISDTVDDDAVAYWEAAQSWPQIRVAAAPA